jgi:hypothetical protein
MKYPLLAFLSLILTSCASTGGVSTQEKSAAFKWPSSKGTVKISNPRTITGTFDGGMKTYDGAGLRGDCGQNEDMEPIFILKNGAKLRNCIIKNAPDGIHVEGDKVLIEKVYFPDVCEDAITIKSGSDDTTVQDCGFDKAADKIVQVNGGKNSRFLRNYFRGFKSATRVKKGAYVKLVEGNSFNNGSGAVVLDKGVKKPTMKGNRFSNVQYQIRQ